MTPDTLTALVSSLRQLRLLTVEQLDECARELEPRLSEPRDLTRALVQRGWLTSYQVNELILDRGEGLLLGSYVLLDKLGEGGMGTVYKARNWKLDKIVALKVIRKDRLLRPDTIKRFYREIRAVAQLDHPNIVRAYDADEVGNIHYFVMEYVEGSDLNQLVKKQGPLPIREACEYIRQAAMGLQHAFERGLVHRDIKPHNLLLASGGRKPPESETGEDTGGLCPPLGNVKILDMGLALVESPTQEDDHSGTMTQSGIVMGTPDYMAPEQSRNAHDVDIRADLYSLGCTLYFLLVGRAPFGGGTLTQKLLRHQNDPPDSIKKHRPDVPDEVEALVHQLMAKQPEDRYQTPRELAQALEILQSRLPSLTPSTTVPLPESTAPTPVPTDTQIGVREGWAEIAPAPAPGERPTAPLSRLMVPMLAVLAILLVSAGGIWWATRPGEKREPDPIGKRPTPPRPKPDDKGKVIPDNGDILSSPGPVTDEWLQAVQALTATQQYQVVLAKMTALNQGFIPNHSRNSWKIRDNKIVAIEFEQPVTDISPLRALKHLETLACLARTNSNPPTPIVSVADLSPLKDLPLTKLVLNCNRIEDLTPLIGMKLTELQLQSTWVRDLTPLKDMHTLTLLHLHNTRVQSLEPLRGLRLDSLHFPNTAVTDLSPLEKMPLRNLSFSGCQVGDLSKLPVGTLTSLDISCCPLEDLSRLANAKQLKTLALDGVPFRSLDALKSLELTSLTLGYHPKHANLLRGLSSLQTINNEDIKEFWKVVDPDPEQERWLQETARLAPSELHKAVRNRVKALNPDYKGEPQFKAADDGVALELPEGGPLMDLRFVAAIKSLSRLKLEGNDPQLRNLEPLRGLSLRVVHLGKSLVQDLSPLSGMPLERLVADSSLVRDLSPLKDTRLVSLQVGTHPGSAPVGGLAALSSLPLLALHAPNLMTRELSVLKSFKELKRLWLPYNEALHHEALLPLGLDSIFHQTPERFWKDIAEQQESFVRREMKRLHPGFVGTLDFVTKKDRIREVTVRDDGDLDLTPLRALPDLQWVRVYPLSEEGKGQFSRLGPLKGMNLTFLTVHRAPQLKDLQPLKGMKLRGLDLHFTGVEDLTPIEGMPLNQLVISQTPVADISSLRGMKLTTCVMDHTRVKDVSPLYDMPLQTLFLPFNLYRDMEWMRKIKTLKNVNSQVAEVFWKEIDTKQADFQKWCDDVAKKPAKEQVEAVLARLKELHPDFTATVTYEIEGDQVLELSLIKFIDLKDLSPLRALPGLKSLILLPANVSFSKLTDLYPLRDLRLEKFDVRGVAITDLNPLRDMISLTTLRLGNTGVSDLTPLRNLRLRQFECGHCRNIHDLSPLKDMKLEVLDFRATKVADITPLRGMPLWRLGTDLSSVRDFSPLKGMELKDLRVHTNNITDHRFLANMPLENLMLDFVPWRDSSLLRSIKTLKTVNYKPARESHAWADWEDAVRAAPPKQQLEMVRAKLIEVNGPDTDVTGVKDLLDKNAQAVTELHCYGDFKDVSPVRALADLQTLYLGQGLQTGKKSTLADIAPLRGMRLKRLSLCGSAVVDLEPLRGMALEWLVL